MAFDAGNADSVPIDNPGRALVTLDLPAGRYAIFGKATVFNIDGDDQLAECRLSTGDRSGADLASIGELGWFQTIPVQDVSNLDSQGTVSLSCSTHDGWAEEAKLTAIKVS